MARMVGAMVAMLVAVALFLAGCGGGSATHDCVNKNKFSIKTQTFSGKGTLNVKSPIQSSGVADIASKIDVDKISIREDVGFSVPLNGTKMDVKTKMFFDYDKELLACAVDASGGGRELSKCAYMKLTGIKQKYSADMIKQGIQLLGGLLNSKMQCKSNDGTYDSFELSEKVPDSSIPLNQTGFTGEVTATTLYDKDLMLHSASLTFDLNTPAKHVVINKTAHDIPKANIHFDASFPVDGGVGKPNGPSASDLDYSSWGSCTEIKPNVTSLRAFGKQLCNDVIKNVFNNDPALGHLCEAMKSMPADLMLSAVDRLQDGLSRESAAFVV